MTAQCEYGTAELRAHYAVDGTVSSVEVVRADDVIAISAELWNTELSPDENGIVTLDSAGEYRYRKVSEDQAGHVICERVRD